MCSWQINDDDDDNDNDNCNTHTSVRLLYQTWNIFGFLPFYPDTNAIEISLHKI